MPDNPLWMFRPFLSPAPLPLEVISQLQEPMKALQMWLFFSLLLVGAIFDCQKRLIPNTICALITIVGLLVFHPAQLMGPLAALPLLAAAMHKPGSIGGGDIKFTPPPALYWESRPARGAWRLALPLPHCFMQSTGAHRSSAEESARRPARQLCLWRRFFPLDLLSFTF